MYFNLGYFGVQKDFPEKLTSIPYRKQRNHEPPHRRKRLQHYSLEKFKYNGRTYYLSIEKIPNNEQISLETNLENTIKYQT